MQRPDNILSLSISQPTDDEAIAAWSADRQRRRVARQRAQAWTEFLAFVTQARAAASAIEQAARPIMERLSEIHAQVQTAWASALEQGRR